MLALPLCLGICSCAKKGVGYGISLIFWFAVGPQETSIGPELQALENNSLKFALLTDQIENGAFSCTVHLDQWEVLTAVRNQPGESNSI